MNRRSKLLAAVGLVFIVITLILVAINVTNWEGLTRGAVLCMMWAEIVLFGGLIVVERLAGATQQVFFRSAAGVVVVFYAMAAGAVSLLFLWRFKQAATAFATIQLSLLGVGAAMFLAFWSIGKGLKGKNDAVLAASASVGGCISRLLLLSENPDLAKYHAILRGAAETLKFSDISLAVREDDEIESALSALESCAMEACGEQSMQQFDTLCRQINALIAKRKLAVAEAKHGGV